MDNLKSPPPPLTLDNIRVIKVLGKGAMGTVFLVHDTFRDPSALSPFALKSIFPSSKPDADRRARWETTVLSRLRHPFLPTLLGFSETLDILSYAVPYCPGGDLNVLRYSQSDHVFSPSVIRFYLAEIVLALEHLHSLGIAYRDLKPENILIQQSGHVTLTDFDLSRSLTPKKDLNSLEFYSDPEKGNLPPPPTQSKKFRQLAKLVLPNKKYRSATTTRNGPRKVKSARVSPVSRRNPSSFYERSNSFVGTDEYVAPEIVRGEGHEFSVDWWALGVLCYEMLYGTTPFKGKNRKDTFRRILMMEPEFIGKKNALTDLIAKLLEKDPTRRLGYRRGALEIKEHEFFHGLRWDLLTEVVRPPFLPLSDAAEFTEEVKKGWINITEYFQKLKAPPESPLWSPSHDEWRSNVSLTEF